MKKIFFLSVIITATLVSCSTDDISTYEENSSKTNLSKENSSDFNITSRDSIDRENDSVIAIDPIKPKKD